MPTTSTVTLKVSEQLQDTLKKCLASASMSSTRLLGLHNSAKFEEGQRAVERMIAHLAVAMEWCPRLFVEAAAAERAVAASSLSPPLKELALAQMLGQLMQLPAALALPRTREVREMFLVFGDEAVGLLLGYFWKIPKIVKRLTGAWKLRGDQLAMHEELMSWIGEWNDVLVSSFCNAALFTGQHIRVAAPPSPEQTRARLKDLNAEFLEAVQAKEREIFSLAMDTHAEV